jgi:hypothetical protein
MIDMNQFGKVKKTREKSVKITDTAAKALYLKAVAAGKAAVDAAMRANMIQPMIVGEAKSLFSNEIDYSKKTYFEPDGVCGFAYIHIRPSTGGFAAWCKKNNIGRYSEYNRSHYIGVSDYNQSMQKKEIYARAFAAVIREAGINCYMESRID